MKQLVLPLILLLVACTSSMNKKGTSNNDGKAVTGIVSFDRDSTEIAYLEKGNSRSCLLFVHGWNISKEYWSDQLNAFGDKYHVFAIDLPGFGESKANRDNWTFEGYGQDVADFITEKDLKNVILVGHSMGGIVVLEAALRVPDRITGIVGVDNFKMVGVETSPEMEQQISDFMVQLQNNFAQVSKGYAANYLFHAQSGSVAKQRVMSDYANANKEVAISSFENLMIYSRTEKERLAQLNQKLYLIQSDGIPTNVNGLTESLPEGFEILKIDNVGHFPMIEKPEEFNEKLQEILSKI